MRRYKTYIESNGSHWTVNQHGSAVATLWKAETNTEAEVIKTELGLDGSIEETDDMPSMDEILEVVDKCDIKRYRYSYYRNNHDGYDSEIGSTLSWSELDSLQSTIGSRDPKPTDFYVPRLLSGGDYSNSCAVEASNCRLFLEENEEKYGVHRMYGDYGSYAVAIRLECITYQMLDTFRALEDYPCIDDEDSSMLEMEWQDSNWESWVFSDYKRELVKAFNAAHGFDKLSDEADTFDNGLDDVSSEDLRQLFEETMERINVYWECEAHESMHVDYERIAENTDMDEVQRLITAAQTKAEPTTAEPTEEPK
jgi:hypothetical protein